jgi:hypothetical protein
MQAYGPVLRIEIPTFPIGNPRWQVMLVVVILLKTDEV